MRPARLRTIRTLSATLLVAALSGAALASPPEAPRYTPTDALDLLMAGNVRFSSGLCEHRNAETSRVHDTAEAQAPFAIVLACADSRVPVERIFDRGVGDVFTVRVAGNTCGPFQAGSIEYAVEHLGSPLLVVLGHSSCGAVKAAASGAPTHGNIAAMLAPIAPAIADARATAPDAQPDVLIPVAVRANVMRSISDLISSSPTLAAATERGALRVVGAVYNLEDGRVEWLGQHPEQNAIIAAALKPAANASASTHADAATLDGDAAGSHADSGKSATTKTSRVPVKAASKTVDAGHASKSPAKHAGSQPDKHAHADHKSDAGHDDHH